MRCVFYLHQNAQVYSEYFKSASARITIGLTDNYDIQTLLKQAAVLITDYSSVCYDFAYMHKPVIYYQFDRKTFEEKQYAPGDNFSYEANGFGNVCDDINDLMAELRSLENADNAMADKFIKRVDGYFSFFDHENCSRIHSAIAAML